MSSLHESEKFDILRRSFLSYLSITEELVVLAYIESAVDIIFERSLAGNRTELCIMTAKLVLERKKIPDKYARLLLEPFENKFIPEATWFSINTFARLRLAYDLSLLREPKTVIHERYKTLAIMTDPKMNVVKHFLEMRLLDVLSWRF